jgi:hypothetical protein
MNPSSGGSTGCPSAGCDGAAGGGFCAGAGAGGWACAAAHVVMAINSHPRTEINDDST